MSYSSGDTAEQVVRMTLEGAEVAAKITGAGAKQIAILLYAVLKDQKRTKGKVRLTNMLRSGKELKVFAVQDKDLAKFCKEAKKYGVLYCVLKDRDANDGITDVMARAEDASKINRIFERFQLSTVDVASVRSEVERARANRAGEDIPEPERPGQQPDKVDVFLDALMANPSREEPQTTNPTEARVEKSRQSAPSSVNTRNQEGRSMDEPKPRRSVRQQLNEIRNEMNEGKKPAAQKREPIQHQAPRRKKSRKKER